MRVYPPPKAHEVAKREEQEEAAAKRQFEDDFDEISSQGTTKCVDLRMLKSSPNHRLLESP